MHRRHLLAISLTVTLLLVMAACSPGGPAASEPGADSGALTIYSGRNERLIAPLIQRFQDESGIAVQVRYGDTAELAAAILEEGANSPADVYIAQDAGGLGALRDADRLIPLPGAILSRVSPRFRAPNGEWVGISGRARVVVYNTDALSPEDLPGSIHGYTDPAWRDKIGWAPTNGSFQAFVTALRLVEGDDAALAWLRGIQANAPRVYANNTAIVQAVGAGEVQVGFVNHYYLLGFLADEGASFTARNHYPPGGDPGAMVNVAGAAILSTSRRPDAAERLIAFLLSDEAQRYFADETFEYPLVEGVPADPALPPLDQLQTPDLDLSDLSGLARTLELLREAGVL